MLFKNIINNFGYIISELIIINNFKTKLINKYYKNFKISRIIEIFKTYNKKRITVFIKTFL